MPSFEQNWIPFTEGYFVPSLVEIGPMALEKKMWKVFKRTDGRTDGRTDRQTTNDRWSEKLTRAFSSGELKTQLSNISSPTVLFPLTRHFISKRMLQCFLIAKYYKNSNNSWTSHKVNKSPFTFDWFLFLLHKTMFVFAFYTFLGKGNYNFSFKKKFRYKTCA